MRPSWKTAVVGTEVTLLAAFTGVGIHLAMSPRREAPAPPPPILLPIRSASPLPLIAASKVASVPEVPAPVSSSHALGPDLLRNLGNDDHNLLVTQWDILQQLMKGIETYIQGRLLPVRTASR